MNRFAQILNEKKQLSYDEAYAMQQAILQGQINSNELVEIFSLMDGRYPTLEEMNGIITATRESMVPVNIEADALDIVGTGGDGLKTFNISTAASIVCAACDVPIVKHGNRSASSRCGSADVLETLGVNIMLNAEQSISCFEKTGMVFLFAPLFHPSLKNAAEARKAFGKRTYFNILGPLVNPAKVSHQTLGVFDKQITELMGETSIKNGAKSIWVVRSNDGMDELSLFSMPDVRSFSPHVPRGEEVKLHYELSNSGIEEIQVKDVNESACIITNIFDNDATEVQTQTVIINAAIGLMTYGNSKNFGEAMDRATEVIKSGRAMKKLQQLIEVSNHV
jgi:anthranilate phosphoribosyltransferase